MFSKIKLRADELRCLYFILYDVLYVKSCMKIWFPLMFERVTWYNAFRYDFNPERSNANYTGTHYTVIIRVFFQCLLYVRTCLFTVHIVIISR